MNQTPMFELYKLMMRTVREMQQTASALDLFPLELGLNVSAPSIRTEWHVTRGNQGDVSITARTSEGDSYTVQFPGSPKSLADFKAKVTLRHGTKVAEERDFSGSELFTAQFEGPFEELHRAVLGYLDRVHGLSRESVQNAKPVAPPSSQPVSGQELEQASDTDEYRWYRVRRNNAPDLRFQGKLLARVITPLYQGRQQALYVFETPSKKVVAVREGRSLWLSEHDRVEVRVVDKLEDVAAFFGYSRAAKILYRQLNLAEQLEEVMT